MWPAVAPTATRTRSKCTTPDESLDRAPPLPTARSGLAAAVLDGRIHVFGGEGNPATPTGVFSENESYDVASGTWRTELAMRTPRHGIGAATIGTHIYIPAGATIAGFGTSDVHESFGAESPRRRAVRR